MARNAQVARRYANALYELCQSEEAAKLEATEKELLSVLGAIQKDPTLERFLTSPVLEQEEKLEVFSGLEKNLPNTYRFFTLLLEASRFNCLKEIVEHFVRLREEATGELTADVVVARQMPDKVVKNIQQLLEETWQRKVKMKFDVDPKVIGGFVARAPGRIVDASVKSQMEHLKEVALH